MGAYSVQGLEEAFDLMNSGNTKAIETVSQLEEATKELKTIFNITLETVQLALQAIELKDKEKVKLVNEKENEIDVMERKLRKNHIIRLNEDKCTGLAGIIFADIISNLERVSDHAKNIANTVR